MIFTSFNFLIFFPSVAILYFIIPNKIRVQYLLTISLFFYFNIQPIYSILLILVSLITYNFALIIEKEENEVNRVRYLSIGIIMVFLPLFVFKYYNFVNAGVFNLLENLGIRYHLPNIKLILPIGISFYTFMAIGYLVDVFNEEMKAEKEISVVFLFLSFFPLVLSGPIERAGSMMPQFKGKLVFNYDKAVTGFQLILWGYFMKLVVADRIAIFVQLIFSNIEYHSGKTLLLAVLLYPVQLYGDLGGYSLIAIGTASILGFNVRPNFNRPFCATSLSEFWRRWHMSLISWILKYIYTPLSFALRSLKMKGIILTVILTLFVMGMWHGATLTFLMWAMYQGLVLSFEAITKNKKYAFEKKYNLTNNPLYLFISIIVTYLIFAFSFLTGGNRHSFSEGVVVLNKILTNSEPLYIDSPSNMVLIFTGISLLFLNDFTNEFLPDKFLFFKNKSNLIRLISYSLIIILILLIGVFDGGQFIYFKY